MAIESLVSYACTTLRRSCTVFAATALVLSAGCQPSDTKTGSDGSSGLTSAAVQAEPEGDLYLVTLNVTSTSGSIGALQFEIEGSDGGFAGAGAAVECDSMVDEALAAFSRHEPTRVVGALIDVSGFATPNTIARCAYVSPTKPTAGGFSVKVTEASDVSAQALAEPPTMVVSKIQAVQ